MFYLTIGSVFFILAPGATCDEFWGLLEKFKKWTMKPFQDIYNFVYDDKKDFSYEVPVYY